MGQPDKERHLPDGVILNNRYKIIRFLSAGGFGNTYEAEDIEEGSHVAVKELFISGTCKRDDDSCGVTISVAENRMLFSKQKDKFRKEANRLRSIHHPNVVRVRDEFEANGTAYYVMDFVRGKSLADMLREGALNEKKSVQYIKQVLSALEAVHNAGILHLDIKPGNVMVDDNNSVVLIDFGASKQLEMVDGKSLSLSTGMAFTPGFAPIEQMAGKRENIGISADIYAIGATLYKLITGVTPPDPSELMVNGLPEIKASPEVQEAIKASVQNNYKARPQSVAEFRAILNNVPFDKNQVPILSHSAMPTPKNGGVDKTLVDNNTFKYSSLATAEQQAEIDKLLADMVWIEGGTFTMGYKGFSFMAANEKPAHSETVGGFYLCKYEVTQKLWSAVMRDNHSKFKGNNLPVECVSWNDCQAFINKLNELTNNKYGFRLPTEAEWEYAARGGSRSLGYKYSGSDNLGSVAWYDGNSGSKTHAVGGKSPNELGLYDMSGNVWEWTSSKWCRNYNCPRNSSNYVLRGGSWSYDAKFCRVSFRVNRDPGNRYFYGGGLRLAH